MAATLTEEQTQALKKQIEFYFSDSNYPRDKFMRTTAAENNGRILFNNIHNEWSVLRSFICKLF